MGVDVRVSITSKRNKSNFNAQELKLRREASRLVSMANKRLKRIEKQDLTQTPAYRKWIDDGGQKFGISGKSMEEVKQEVARLNNFLKKQSSTVRGAKKYLDNVAEQIGIDDISDYPQAQRTINNFFEVTAKVKEYLYNSKEIGVSIGYRKIWEEVSNYVQEVGHEVELTEKDVFEIAGIISQKGALGYVDKTLDSFLDEF